MQTFFNKTITKLHSKSTILFLSDGELCTVTKKKLKIADEACSWEHLCPTGIWRSLQDVQDSPESK